jgi:hypothetical protein
MLGVGPCYHMVNVLADLSQADLWKRALAGEDVWDELLGDFNSTVDWPGGFFYKELADKYPDAKVLLSWRDPERWEASMRQTVWAFRHGDNLMRLLSDARAKVDPAWAGFGEMIDGLLWKDNGTFADVRHEDTSELIAAAERHNEAVKAAIPADRLLVWDVKQGWEPLCEFLELPVPDDPFPNVNDSAEFVDRVVDAAILTLSDWRREKQANAESQAQPA